MSLITIAHFINDPSHVSRAAATRHYLLFLINNVAIRLQFWWFLFKLKKKTRSSLTLLCLSEAAKECVEERKETKKNIYFVQCRKDTDTKENLNVNIELSKL